MSSKDFAHTSDRVSDSRFHEIGEEVIVSEGRGTATVGACLSTGPDPDDAYGPVVYVGGLGACDLTVVEAQVCGRPWRGRSDALRTHGPSVIVTMNSVGSALPSSVRAQPEAAHVE